MNSAFKTSFDSVRRAPFQALAAISVLALTFFVGTILAILVYSSSQVLAFFETRPQVIAFLKEEATLEEIGDLQEKLKADERLKDVSFVSREQAFEIYKGATLDNPLLAELVSPSVFPASLEFSVVNLDHTQEIIDEIKGQDVVESVGFTASLGGEISLSEVIERLKRITYYLRLGGLGLTLILGATSLLVLMVIIGMRIVTRRGEIETLSLVGATRGFIRTPIIYEAMIYVVSGVVLGWLVAVVVLLYATPSIIAYFGEVPVLPKDSVQFFGFLALILVGEILVGAVIALAGSLLAVSRSLRSR